MRFAAPAFSVFFLACGATPETDVADGGIFAPATCAPASALQTVTSASGNCTVSGCSNQTPARGENAFTLLIADSNGQPMDGLTVGVQPWMPDMGHGSSVNPTITAVDGGLYQVTNCVFTMGGVWQLRTTLSSATGDAASDDAVLTFTID